MQPLVEVRDLHYQYDDGTVALDGVDFQLFSGETVAVLGANGSGKTTFVLHLNGLLMGQGSVTVCGTPVSPNTLTQVRQKVGLVFQDSDNQLFMPTVIEDVAFGPLNLGLDRKQARTRAQDALAAVGMAHVAGKAPYHLSAGEKKRVAIAGILAMSPEILVLDEPTTFLDPPGQNALLELLEKLPQAKILVTHDVDCARVLASRAVFFERGKITADGSVEDVVARNNWDRVALRRPVNSRI
jgi:cobalt/nickel transport system ATP-binding protein